MTTTNDTLSRVTGVGPFTLDPENGRITLAAGVYRLSQPIIFGIVDETIITGVRTWPLAEEDPQ